MRCKERGCKKESRTRGWCIMHYTRWSNHGDPSVVLKVSSYFGAKCSVRSCPDKANDSFRMCGKHAQRTRRYGSPGYVTSEARRRELSRESQPKLGKLKPTTYKKYLGRHEHRVVMEKKLGRKLRRNEIVHHIDHDRHNNHPSNLAVLSPSEHIRAHRKQMTDNQRAKSKIKNHIRTIRKMLSDGIAQSKIAIKFGVSQTMINHINVGKAWRGFYGGA